MECVRQAEARLALGPAWDTTYDLVFPNTIGKPMDGTNLLHYHFYRLLKRAELPHIRFHDLRHTAATLLLGRGVNPKIVSEMLGHASIGITLDIYSHVLPDMQQHAAGGDGCSARNCLSVFWEDCDSSWRLLSIERRKSGSAARGSGSC